MLAFILPTRDRPEHLARTLARLGALPAHLARAGAEVVVVDNAPLAPADAPSHLANALPVRILRSPENLGAAARNLAAQHTSPCAHWLVMLDDDSHPMHPGFLDALASAPADVLALAAEIFLPSGAREAGGLPEVFVGCGVALRREAFLDLHGYDPTFGYYAEEYDLAARIILAGGRVALDRRFAVMHEKTTAGRDMNRILARLVRNNGWVVDRYAPPADRPWHLQHTIERYAHIAHKEAATDGYRAGLAELHATLPHRPRTPMPAPLWDRFTGLASARSAIAAAHALKPLSRCALVGEQRGKNAWAVRAALDELAAIDARVTLTDNDAEAQTLVVATLSPGPMLDAADALARTHPGARVVLPMHLPPAPPTPPAAAPAPHAEPALTR